MSNVTKGSVRLPDTDFFWIIPCNIFSNIDPDIMLGNLTALISDMPQFAIMLNMFDIIAGNKSDIYERD